MARKEQPMLPLVPAGVALLDPPPPLLPIPPAVLFDPGRVVKASAIFLSSDTTESQSLCDMARNRLRIGLIAGSVRGILLASIATFSADRNGSLHSFLTTGAPGASSRAAIVATSSIVSLTVS